MAILTLTTSTISWRSFPEGLKPSQSPAQRRPALRHLPLQESLRGHASPHRVVVALEGGDTGCPIVEGGGREAYKEYTELVHNRPPAALRDLLDFSSDRKPIDIERVEPVTSVLRRFQTGAMSLGALSRETHEDIARAMNRIGGQANTGEGGEDPRRYEQDGDLRDANSTIKQVASGRFGVTPAYLAGAHPTP